MTAAIPSTDQPSRSVPSRALRYAALLLGVFLSGCGVLSDDTASTLLVTPGKYQYHNCQLLAGALTGTRARISEMQKLTARASQEAAGQVIGSAAYRTEYLQARGDEKLILATLREKNCQSESTWASERSVY